MNRKLARAAALFVLVSWVLLWPLQALAQLSGLIVTITSPTSGSTVSGTITVSASVGPLSAPVAGVQFKLDGANLGAEDTSAPYSVPWNTTTTSNGSHTLTAVARDMLGLRFTSDPVTVTVSNPPTITSFTPTSGPVGTSVTISGTNFTGATAVAFNGTSASFSVSSATTIQATVPSGATTGPISVTTPDGTATSASAFTVTPTITSFTPTSGPVKTNVTISGTNFTGATTVTFNGVSASFTVSSATTIQTTVPPGAKTGPISVTTPDGTATSASAFTVIASAPTITSFTPTSGPVGTSVTISGTKFTAATTVTFNGVSASFTVSSATTIQTTVPPGATSGPISVTTSGGTATSASSFTVTASPPVITSFTPTSGPAGTSVTISGTNFTGATAVTFNGTSASFSVSSATTIQATVPSGATSGPISVTTPDGTATSASSFTVGPPLTSGDVFLAFANDGRVQWYNPDGSLRQALVGTSNGQASSVAFDAAGNIYVPHWYSNPPGAAPGNLVARFDANGNLLPGTFGSGYNCNPSTMAFDAAGNMYVGQADCTGDILKFDAAGNLVASFDALTTNRGTDHIDLASDGCTMFYSSRDKNIYRFNVCTNTQLLPFNIQPLPGDTAYHVRVLPDGGVLVADSAVIVRLDAAGNQIQTYVVSGETNYWGGVDYGGDGTFWATNAWTDKAYKFDLQSGAVLATINSGTSGFTLAGVGVRR